MTIDDFQETVMQIKPNNFMGLNGSAAGIIGSSSTGSDIVTQLQRSVVELTKLTKSTADPDDIKAARRAVMANIMVAATVDAISEQFADELVEKLHEAMKGKE